MINPAPAFLPVVIGRGSVSNLSVETSGAAWSVAVLVQVGFCYAEAGKLTTFMETYWQIRRGHVLVLELSLELGIHEKVRVANPLPQPGFQRDRTLSASRVFP